MKKIFAMTVTTCLAFSLAACGSTTPDAGSSAAPAASQAPSSTAPTPTPEAPAELTYLANVTPNYPIEMYQGFVKKFTDANPTIKINIIKAPDVAVNDYAKTLLASGSFPDVLQGVGGDNYMDANAFLEIPVDNDIKKIKGYEQDLYWKDQKLYAISPFFQPALVIYYNKKLFADAGITQTPKTWDQFMDTSKKLKDKGTTPVLLGGESLISYVFGEMITPSVFGNAQTWNVDRYAGKVHFTDANFVKALGRYNDLTKNGYVNKGTLSLAYNTMATEFLKGKIGMYPMGSWEAGPLKDAPFEIGVFLPPSEDGKVYAGGDHSGGFSVSSKTKYPAAAIKFIKYMALDPEVHKTLAQKDSQISNLTEPISYDMTPIQKAVFDAVKGADMVIGHSNGKLGGRGAANGMYDAFGKVAQDSLMGKADDIAAELKYLDDIWDKNATK